MKIVFKTEYKNARHAEIIFEQENEDSSVEVYINYMQEKNGEWEIEEICTVYDSDMEKLAKLFIKGCACCGKCNKE